MTIKIGQLDTIIESTEGLPFIKIGVENAFNSNAPRTGDQFDYQNKRITTEDDWRETVDHLHLEDLFYDEETGLFRKPSGITPLTKEHIININIATDYFYKVHPEARTGPYAAVDSSGNFTPVIPQKLEQVASDITWLHFWVNWAISHCSKPVISNTEFIYH